MEQEKYILKQINGIRKILSWNWSEKDILIDEYLVKIEKRLERREKEDLFFCPDTGAKLKHCPKCGTSKIIR